MLHFSRLVIQKRAQTALSSQLKASTQRATSVSSNAASSLWSAIEQSRHTCMSAIRRFTSYTPLSTTSTSVARAEIASKGKVLKSSAFYSKELSSRRIAGFTSSTQHYGLTKRSYQAQWNFRNAYQAMGGTRALFDWKRPLAFLIAANVGVYLMWGVRKLLSKSFISQFPLRRLRTQLFQVSDTFPFLPLLYAFLPVDRRSD